MTKPKHTKQWQTWIFFFFFFLNSLCRQSKRFADCRLLLRWLLPRNFCSIFVAVIFLLVCFPFSFSFCHLHGNWVNFKTATSSHSHLHLNIWMLRDVCPQLELFSIKKKKKVAPMLPMIEDGDGDVDIYLSTGLTFIRPKLGWLPAMCQCLSLQWKKSVSNTKNYSTFTYSN